MSTDDTDTTDRSTATQTSSACGAATSTEEATENETASETNTSACGASAATTETEEATDAGASKCGAAGSSSSSTAACGASDDDSGSRTDAIEEKIDAKADAFDAEPGSLTAVGLGPGQPEGMTQRARSALLDAEHIVGYTTYMDLLPAEVTDGADELYDTPMCGEVSRTEEAVDRALAGHDVAIIGSGDPNVYALGGLALEILESKEATASMVDFDVVPGVPAAQSCAARVGAPLVNDSVSISLSDHLTPMATIESRLEAVASEGFTVAIYNPWSRKRRENFERACDILLEHRPADTPVGVVHGAGREDEVSEVVELGDLKELGETDLIDMTTTILVGNEATYVWDDRMVTPRGYERKYEY